MGIAENIRAARKAAGLTQDQVEERDPRIDQSALSKWETGTTPDVAQLLKLATVFKVPVDFLVAGENKDYDATREHVRAEEELLAAWRQVQSVDTKRALVNAAKHAVLEERSAARKRKVN